MYLIPEYSKRRANVLSSFAAAIVAVGMIVVAGKASATQSGDPQAQASSTSQVQADPDSEASSEARKASTSEHAGHASQDHAASSQTETDQSEAPSHQHDTSTFPSNH